jgi:hypothetical protein
VRRRAHEAAAWAAGDVAAWVPLRHCTTLLGCAHLQQLQRPQACRARADVRSEAGTGASSAAAAADAAAAAHQMFDAAKPLPNQLWAPGVKAAYLQFSKDLLSTVIGASHGRVKSFNMYIF